MGCFAFPVAVYLRRHFGFRLVVLCAAVLVAFAFISTPFMPKLHFLYLTYSIPFGIGAGFIDCFSVITLREFFAKYLSIALGMRFAASSIGQIVWSYLLPVLLDAVGWRKTFMAFSSFSIACIFYAMVYRRPTVHQTGEKISAKDHDIADAAAIPRKRGASYGFLRNTAFLFLLVACLMVALVIAVPAMFIVRGGWWLLNSRLLCRVMGNYIDLFHNGSLKYSFMCILNGLKPWPADSLKKYKTKHTPKIINFVTLKIWVKKQDRMLKWSKNKIECWTFYLVFWLISWVFQDGYFRCMFCLILKRPY